MTYQNTTTTSRKGKHLSYEERCQIEAYKKLEKPLSNRAIARLLGRAPQTIHQEIKDGTVRQIRRQKSHGKIYEYASWVYIAQAGQAAYDKARQQSVRKPKWATASQFMAFADRQMTQHEWSPDAVIGHVKKKKKFTNETIPSTSTLYHYIHKGIMKTRNINLLLKVKRTTKKAKPRANKRVLGPSIDQRPESVNQREHLGDWEIDTVIGQKAGKKAVLLTLVERKTRYTLIMKINHKGMVPVNQAMEQLMDRLGEDFTQLFKTITADNGSEFAGLHDLLDRVTDVYFTHPYASYERGTNETHNGIIRRFIPKGTDIDTLSTSIIQRIQHWMNTYPRKILNYATPQECFNKELRAIGID